jgi:hypothetical protein
MHTLQRRVANLEARPSPTTGRAHRIIVELGESHATATVRYEQENGCTIFADDMVIYRKIIN